MMTNHEDVDAQLREARARMQAFEESITGDRLLRRLERESPAHPLLLGYKFFIGLMAVDVALALVILAVPLVSMDWARRIVSLELRIGIPVPIALLVLAGCATVLGLALRQLAASRGQQSPLLADEMKEHQAIASDIAQLTSKKRLQDRGLGA